MLDVSALVPVGIHHPWIQQYLSVKQKSQSHPERLACLEGLWAVSLALNAKLEIHTLFVCPELVRSEATRQCVEKLLASGVPSCRVSEKVLARLVNWDGPDGLAAIVKLRCFGWHDIPLRPCNRIVVLDGLENPGNIGTIIRCADGAGADAIIMTGRRKCLSHPKLLHASMGSAFSFPVIEAETDEAINWLHRSNFSIVTTDTTAPLSYREASYAHRVAIIMGNERHGISPAWYAAQNMSVSIPMHGIADSLNVGNAAVLLLYEVLYHHS